MRGIGYFLFVAENHALCSNALREMRTEVALSLPTLAGESLAAGVRKLDHNIECDV